MSEVVFNTFWTVSEFNKSRSVAIDALKNHGLEGMLGNLSRRASVDRAVKSLHDRRHKAGKRLTEKVVESVETIIWGILNKEGGDEDNTVKYSQKTTIMMNKDTGEVSVSGDMAKEVMDAVHQYDDSFTDDDVRMILRRVIRAAKGISLRPTGGVYQLLDAGLPVLNSMKEALTEMGIPAKVYIQKVYADEGLKEIVTKSLEDEVDQRLEVIMKRVEGISRSKKAAAGQADEIMEVQELLDTYRDLLSDADSYNTMMQKVMDAANKVSEAMMSLEDKSLASDRSLTVGEIAEKVLKEAKKPMRAVDIFNKAVETGLLKKPESPEKEKAASVSFNSGIFIAEKGGGSFKKVGRGLYEFAG